MFGMMIELCLKFYVLPSPSQYSDLKVKKVKDLNFYIVSFGTFDGFDLCLA